MERDVLVFLAQVPSRCPFGLGHELQTIHTILLRLDIPRGQIPIQLFLNLLRGRALGSPLERQIKITELVKDVFGDRYGELVPLSFHVLKRPQLGEDWLPDEMRRLKHALSKRSDWE